MCGYRKCYLLLLMASNYNKMERIAQIENCEALLLSAIKQNNIEQLDILLHDDLRFLNPLGQILTKSMDIDNYKSGQIKIETIEPSDRHISLINDTAVVDVKIKLKGKYMEHTLDENFQYIRVWAQADGSWKVIAGSAARI